MSASGATTAADSGCSDGVLLVAAAFMDCTAGLRLAFAAGVGLCVLEEVEIDGSLFLVGRAS